MTTGPANSVLPYLCRTALRGDGAGLSDGELLERFRSRRDEAAFEALLRRHGPMVLGVCRRLLQNSADAEDAFQATFLVLLCKAGSIDPPWMVGKFFVRRGLPHGAAGAGGDGPSPGQGERGAFDGSTGGGGEG